MAGVGTTLPPGVADKRKSSLSAKTRPSSLAAPIELTPRQQIMQAVDKTVTRLSEPFKRLAPSQQKQISAGIRHGCADKVAMTGQLVSKAQAATKPMTWTYLLPRCWLLECLGLGTDMETQKDQIMAEQTNLGLMAGLCATISWPYLLELQTYDWTQFHGHADLHEGMLMTLSMAATVGFMLSTIHSVITMCFAGELTGPVECAYFADRLGQANLGSFFLWLVGILCFGGALFYHVCLFAPNHMVRLACIAVVVAYVSAWVWVPLLQQKALYDCKFVSYNTQPTALSIDEIDAYAEAFCSRIGIAYISGENLKRFIELNLPPSKISAALPMQLAPGSLRIVEKVAERILDEYVEVHMRKSAIDEKLKAGGLFKDTVEDVQLINRLFSPKAAGKDNLQA